VERWRACPLLNCGVCGEMDAVGRCGAGAELKQAVRSLMAEEMAALQHQYSQLAAAVGHEDLPVRC
jgi:hypothetical protein